MKESTHTEREKKEVVRAGTGIMVMRGDGKVLLGRRHDDPEKANSALSGEGTWTFPGGKHDTRLSPEENAVQELEEETGLVADPKDLTLISVTNDQGPKAHFITLTFICKKFTGEPSVREPDEITQWEWFSLDALPEPMFFPCSKAARNYQDGVLYRPL